MSPWPLCAVGAVAMAELLLPGRAAACGACVCDGELGVEVFPRSSSSSVPQNASFVVWAPNHEASDIRLARSTHDGGSNDVEIRVEAGDAPNVFQVRPLELLAPDGYLITVGGENIASYTVRDGMDTTPPTTAAVEAADARAVLGAHCGRKLGAAIRVLAAMDDGAAFARPVVRVEIDGLEHPIYVQAEYDGTFGIGRMLEGGTYAKCFGNAELGNAIDAKSLRVRVSVLDYAGNASEARELHVTPALLRAPDCGETGDCHVSDAPAGSSFAASWIPLCGALGWLCRRRVSHRRGKHASDTRRASLATPGS